MKREEDNNDEFRTGYNGFCYACDLYAELDDLGLCDACAGKIERDLIRLRDWEYSVTAFGCPKEKLEELRKQIITQYGEALELLAEEQPKGSRRRRR